MTNIGLSFFVAFGVFVNLAVPEMVSLADVRDSGVFVVSRVDPDPSLEQSMRFADLSSAVPAVRDGVVRFDLAGLPVLASLDGTVAVASAVTASAVSVGIEAGDSVVASVARSDAPRFVVPPAGARRPG